MNQGLGTRSAPSALIAALRTAAERDGHWRPVELDKGSPVDLQLDTGARLIILERGLVKLSYISAEGDERIKSFIVDEGLFGSFGVSEDQS